MEFNQKIMDDPFIFTILFVTKVYGCPQITAEMLLTYPISSQIDVLEI